MNFSKMYYWNCRSKQANFFNIILEMLVLGASICIFSILSIYTGDIYLQALTLLAAVIFLGYCDFFIIRMLIRQFHIRLKEGKFIAKGKYIYHLKTAKDFPLSVLEEYGIRFNQEDFLVKEGDDTPPPGLPTKDFFFVRIHRVDTITKGKDGYTIKGRCRIYEPYRWSQKTYPYTAYVNEKEIDHAWSLMERFEFIQNKHNKGGNKTI